MEILSRMVLFRSIKLVKGYNFPDKKTVERIDVPEKYEIKIDDENVEEMTFKITKDNKDLINKLESFKPYEKIVLKFNCTQKEFNNKVSTKIELIDADAVTTADT